MRRDLREIHFFGSFDEVKAFRIGRKEAWQAHDKLVAALTAIRDGAPDPRELARAALTEDEANNLPPLLED